VKQAIGIIETKGFSTAVGVLDHMLKSANVELIGYKKKLGASLVTITIIGDIGAVNVAILAGENKGNQIGQVVAKHIISRISPDIASAFNFNEEAIQNIMITKNLIPKPKKITNPEKRAQFLMKKTVKSSEEDFAPKTKTND